MGQTISGLLTRLFGKEPRRILILGLDAVGKTTILYRLKLGEVVNTIPTIGFNVETVKYKNLYFTIWDFGGGAKLIPLRKHYFANTQAIIFVVDSTNREQISEAGENLRYHLLDDELKEAVLLVLANKQDIPNAMSTEEIVNKLRIDDLLSKRIWYIQPTSATKGIGLYEGLEWLSQELTKKSF